MNKPKLTLIIPVYNGAAFIQQSLNSLITQIVDGVEIIVIDDGSVDKTVTVIQQNFQQYIQTKQLLVHTQKNQGVSAARNYGISLAHGEFIGFMDADDILLPNYINTIFKVLNNQVDIIEFGFKTFVSDITEITKNPTLYSNNIFGKTTVSHILNKVYSIARWYPWSRIFKATLFEGVRFPIGVRFCEDLMTIPHLYDRAENIYVLRDGLYGYRINPNSATFNVGQDYTEKLIAFYKSIPNPGIIHHAYLRISIAYAIYSCQIKSKDEWQLPKEIQQDLLKLRFSPKIYLNISPRKIAILLYPILYKSFKHLADLLSGSK